VKREITPVEWVIEFGENCSKAVQVPLMLCWAITIHKCQSLTLDKAIMSLGDAFCDHMIYVALSRVRSIEGLYLKSFAASKITVNERVKEFLRDNSS
jgi:ATP-dependent DNA helicase PIF1